MRGVHKRKKESAFLDDYMLLSSALCRYSELGASGHVREPFGATSSLIQFLAFTGRAAGQYFCTREVYH